MAENYFGLTDTGRVRDNNEDTFITESLGDSLVLSAVIDGVGGYNGGEVAAAIAKEVITEHLTGLQGEYIPAMIEALRQASAAIFNKKQNTAGLESMACVVTVAIADIANNMFYYAHVGDTRLYLLRDESLVKISKDHSFVGFLEDSGRLTESAAMNHPKRNEINKALGFTTQIATDDNFIETGSSPFLPGDILLLCSDGLTDLVDKAGILAILSPNTSLKDKAEQLIAAANDHGGKDNITVVLVHNNKTKQRPEAIKPATTIKKSTDPSHTEKFPDPQNAAVSQPKANTEAAPPAKRSNGLTIVLALLCLLFAASTVWFFLKGQKAVTPATTVAVNKAVKDTPIRNPDEIKLQNLLNSVKKDTLTLSDTAFKQAIIISDTLHILKDTLYIRGKGNIVLKRDTGYHGPAIAIAAPCKVIVLDNIKLNGFETAIITSNSSLYLRNTQFINCRVAVQKQYLYTDKKYITTDMPGAKIKEDSSAKVTPKPNGTR